MPVAPSLSVGDHVFVRKFPFPPPELNSGTVVAVLRNGDVVVSLDTPVEYTPVAGKRKVKVMQLQTSTENLELAFRFGEGEPTQKIVYRSFDNAG